MLLIFALTIIAAAYVFFNRADFTRLTNSLNEHYWSVSVGFMHGCLVFFTLLNTYPAFHNIFQHIPYPIIAYSLVVAIAIGTFLASRKKVVVSLNTDHLFSFRVGASLYLGSFLIGSNYDYKFIIFIFTIPQMLAWLKHSPGVRRITLLNILFILFTCWSVLLSHMMYWIIYTFIEESLNWLIFSYYIFMLLNTLPLWLKKMLGFHTAGIAETGSLQPQ